ncbi:MULTISPECIES: hypothetical protein [unclassified Paenibacillus]|uniref:hypothetical protein n=1 Tax=unclassified Paenibacillus TaxID=185978 RepID=UPI0036260E40
MMEEYIYQILKNRILGWDSELVEEIYVLSFYIDFENDDYRKPRLIFGYNTTSNHHNNISMASSELEARWNYAFWLQNEEIVIGNISLKDTREEEVMRENWVLESLWYYTDKEAEENFDRILELGEKIKDDFYKIIKNVVRRLHANGVIVSQFNKEIPLIIHELEYYSLIADINKEINPNESINDFCNWIESM